MKIAKFAIVAAAAAFFAASCCPTAPAKSCCGTGDSCCKTKVCPTK